MTIEHYDNDSEGHFRALIDGRRVGTMTYFWSGEDKIIVNHTEVDPEQSGKGIGQTLVEAAVSFARDRDVKIDPWCPFTKAILHKRKELQDVL